MEIKIIRSENRKRTISGRVDGETLIVNAPADIPEERLQKIIEKFRKRFEKRQLKRQLNRTVDLMTICRKLKEQYFFYDQMEVNSIGYSTDQNCRWGVCNSRNKTILISHRLAEFPNWVRDYVIIHEMAHILEPNHGKRFWRLVRRYKLSERARGYLIAKGYEDADESDVQNGSTFTG
ncbi:MAG: M48 family metallopeptidase [Planctomycetota bacterium]